MQALSHSPFLQALGYAIANSLWQGALVWILTALVNSLFKMPSAIKYRIALTAQLVVFAWFIVTLQFYYTKCSEAMALIASLNADNTQWIIEPQTLTLKTRLFSVILKSEEFLPYLSIAYLLLIIFLTVKWFRSYRYTSMVKTSGLQKIDVEWKLFVQKIAAQLNIKKPVRIYLSSLISSPMTIGFLKPLILLPVASVNHLTPEQLEAILLHELAHIRRADYLVNLLLSIVEITLFFNPFTQLIGKQIKKERENSCDDWVLQYQYNPSMYARALLSIATLQQATPAFAMYAAAPKGDLLSRVRRMLNQPEKQFQYKHQLMALLLITGIMTSIAWLQPADQKPKTEAQGALPQQPNQPVVVEPMMTRVENPLMNPLFFLSKPIKNEVDNALQQAKEEMVTSSKDALKIAQRTLSVTGPLALDQAKEAMRDAVPAALNASSEALKKELALANMNIPTIAPGVDSVYIKNAIVNAMDKVNINFDWKKLNADLDKAKAEFKKMEAKNIRFSEAEINKLVKDAIDKVPTYLRIQAPPAKPVSPAAPTPASGNKKDKVLEENGADTNDAQNPDKRSSFLRLRDLNMQEQITKDVNEKTVQLALRNRLLDSLKQCYTERRVATQMNDNQNWAFSYPGYPAHATPRVCPEKEDTEATPKGDYTYEYKGVKVIVKDDSKANVNQSVRVRNVTLTNNNKDVNIVIDIKKAPPTKL